MGAAWSSFSVAEGALAILTVVAVRFIYLVLRALFRYLRSCRQAAGGPAMCLSSRYRKHERGAATNRRATDSEAAETPRASSPQSPAAAGSAPWAIVTGASDGIGRAFALELARIGFSVCVIARRQDKLNEVVAAIEAICAQQQTASPASGASPTAQAVAFDFSVPPSHPSYAQLFRDLDRLIGTRLAVLVNNVGTTHLWAGEMFADVPMDAEERLINLNCLSMVAMAKYAVRCMQGAASQAGHGEWLDAIRATRAGAIVNISSLTAVLQTVPYFGMYAATKAFARSFSDSLAFEVEHGSGGNAAGIDVLTVTPAFVSTALTQTPNGERLPVSFTVVDPDGLARDTLHALAKDAGVGGSHASAGHRNHVLVQPLFEMLPKTWLARNIFKLVQKEAQELQAAKAAGSAAASDGTGASKKDQ